MPRRLDGTVKYIESVSVPIEGIGDLDVVFVERSDTASNSDVEYEVVMLGLHQFKQQDGSEAVAICWPIQDIFNHKFKTTESFIDKQCVICDERAERIVSDVYEWPTTAERDISITVDQDVRAEIFRNSFPICRDCGSAIHKEVEECIPSELAVSLQI